MIIDIFDYGMNGEGVGKIDGKIILVPNCLNGEVVDVDILQDEGNYAVAKLNKIIKSSKERVKPPCPWFSSCGGCDLQHMSYSEQLKFKSELVYKTIKKISGQCENVFLTIACEKQFQYRNKLSFNFKDDSCGFFKYNSKEIVPVSYCMLGTDNINKIFEIFKEFLKNEEKSGKNTQKFIKNLVVREIYGQILVGVVVSKECELKEFCQILLNKFSMIGVYEIVNSRNDSVVLSGKTIHIGGIKEISISNFGVSYSVDLLGFHQTNLDIQNKIYEYVLNLISSDSVVVNGFSGQGLLSAIIATKAKQVIGIEINSSSHKSAQQLKLKNNIKNLTNLCGDFNKLIGKIKDYDTLILDPSKKGCGKDVLSKIKAPNLIYVSCNPIALAKDITILRENYDIESIQPFDMFPNTKSVETVVKLTKRH